MYSKILVPVDLSHEDVGERILKLADSFKSEAGQIYAMHVVPDMPAYGEAFVASDLFETNAKEAVKALKALVKTSGVSAVDKVEVGAAHIGILDYADKIEADLIIVGSHKPGFSDYFLGSTAARVVRHAKCSVLVDR